MTNLHHPNFHLLLELHLCKAEVQVFAPVVCWARWRMRYCNGSVRMMHDLDRRPHVAEKVKYRINEMKSLSKKRQKHYKGWGCPSSKQKKKRQKYFTSRSFAFMICVALNGHVAFSSVGWFLRHFTRWNWILDARIWCALLYGHSTTISYPWRFMLLCCCAIFDVFGELESRKPLRQ